MKTLNQLKNQFEVLGRDEMKQIIGGRVEAPCGVKVNGVWMEVMDSDGSGTTKEEALQMYDQGYAYYNGEDQPVTGWCCESCPWN